MPADLMIVDDEEDVADAVESAAQLAAFGKYGKTPEIVKFYRGIEALEYLRANAGSLPRAYVIDMRYPYGEAELASPLAIYRFLEQHDATSHFKFFTGHISDHDKYVQKETGAEIILKGKDGLKKLEKFFEDLFGAS